MPLWGVGAIVVAAIAATALIQSMTSRRVETIARHFEVAAPEPFELQQEPVECAISPNGRMLAMVLTDSTGTSSLWVRGMDSFKPRPLPGTDSATQPFWSPDNRSLAFFADGKLKKIAVGGGDPEVLCDVRSARGGTWNRDGVILFAPTSNGPLFTIPARGGEPAAVTRLDSTKHETAHRFPRFLPDGRHYLFSVLGGNTGRITTVAGVLGGDSRRKVVLTAESGAACSPDGYLLFCRNTILSAQRFDLGSLRLSGEPISLGDSPAVPTSTGAPVVTSADDGTLAYMSRPLPLNRLAWFDSQGHELEQVPLALGVYAGLKLSPDGRSALVNRAITSRDFELLVVDLERGTTNKISGEHTVENFAWSPDGKRVAYTESDGGSQSIILVSTEGGPGETVMAPGSDFRRIDGWTPDGKALIIERLDPQTQWDLWVLPVEGDRQARPYLRNPANEFRAAVSPDGRWMSYNSDETGRIEGYVQAFPMPGRRYQVTTDGTGVIRWTADGKQLALGATPNLILRRVDAFPGEEFRFGAPRVVGRLPDQTFGLDSRDGSKLLAVVPAGKQPKPTIRVVLDWTAMLAAR
jgi:Tol biopolymer transport system component